MTGFSSLLCYPFSVPLVNVHGDGDNDVECVIDMIGLSQPIFDKCQQVLLAADELVVIA